MSQIQLHITKFKQADYARNIWEAVPEHGTTPEAVMHPAYWAHVWESLKPRDRIEVMPDGLDWFATVLVVGVGKMEVHVRLVGEVTIFNAQDADELQSDADFSVKWVGPNVKWAVVRNSDKARIFENLPSKDAATAKLREHVAPKAA